MEKVYVFGTEALAESFKMVAYAFDYDARRIGSALILTVVAYDHILDATYAIPAAMICDMPEQEAIQ